MDLLWTRWTYQFVVQHLNTSRCRGFVVQLVVQQIHNKSNKCSLSLMGQKMCFSESYVVFGVQTNTLLVSTIFRKKREIRYYRNVKLQSAISNSRSIKYSVKSVGYINTQNTALIYLTNSFTTRHNMSGHASYSSQLGLSQTPNIPNTTTPFLFRTSVLVTIDTVYRIMSSVQLQEMLHSY